MKLLVTSRADDNIKDMTSLTFPHIKEYAKKLNADFMQLDHESGCNHEQGKWHYRILKHYELFDTYDRILHIDSDVLITPNAPNIFEEVPYDFIGTVYEDKGSRLPARRALIREVQSRFGDVNWDEGYINTGFFLSSRCHKNIYSLINGEHFYEGFGHDDVHIGYNIRKFKYSIKELSFVWNHMTMFSEPWNGSPSRFDSHIIHYAGKGVFEGSCNSRIDQIKRDIGRLYG